MFDLDGFKHYNDTFGHPAGDALLARLGSGSRRSRRRRRAYRMGGDEFCVLIEPRRGSDAVVAAAARALTERGEGFAIGAPTARPDPERGAGRERRAQLADQRMYADKRAGRARGAQSRTCC